MEWYVIGEDRWRSWKDLPKGQETESFLSGYGRVSLIQEPGREGSHSYVYDPENPVPSHGAESLFSTFQEVGSLLQPEPGYREDVLSFLSDPLPEDLTVLGQVTAELYVKSEAEDTAFTAKLMEVTPEESLISGGPLRRLLMKLPTTPERVRALHPHVGCGLSGEKRVPACVWISPLRIFPSMRCTAIFLGFGRNRSIPKKRGRRY